MLGGAGRTRSETLKQWLLCFGGSLRLGCAQPVLAEQGIDHALYRLEMDLLAHPVTHENGDRLTFGVLIQRLSQWITQLRGGSYARTIGVSS
jgi:hypothetical protein